MSDQLLPKRVVTQQYDAPNKVLAGILGAICSCLNQPTPSDSLINAATAAAEMQQWYSVLPCDAIDGLPCYYIQKTNRNRFALTTFRPSHRKGQEFWELKEDFLTEEAFASTCFATEYAVASFFSTLACRKKTGAWPHFRFVHNGEVIVCEGDASVPISAIVGTPNEAAYLCAAHYQLQISHIRKTLAEGDAP